MFMAATGMMALARWDWFMGWRCKRGDDRRQALAGGGRNRTPPAPPGRSGIHHDATAAANLNNHPHIASHFFAATSLQLLLCSYFFAATSLQLLLCSPADLVA
jgi:hypothetical protein